MRNILTLSLICLLLPTVTAFFFGGGSGAACGCAAPACSPPPPPSGCAPPARAVARGAKTMSFDQPLPVSPTSQPRIYTVPDELDLRAAAFGVPIEPQPQFSIFDILHNLGESGDSPAQQLVVADGSTNTDYFPKENDEDLTVSDMTGSGGLYRGKEIRRAPAEPTVHVHRDGEIESTTSPSENVKVDTGDEKFDENKCNSQVLRKLMIDNMSDSSADSKKNINIAAEGKLGGNVDVICSRGHFSYIFTSNLYCEATHGLTTCIAFRQSDKVRRRR
uniref:Ground-like domain-containing protein n=1 Tax=Caenorhabditis japonica TaxID=281687 RepID=A0A8R1DTF2_CAEJA